MTGRGGNMAVIWLIDIICVWPAEQTYEHYMYTFMGIKIKNRKKWQKQLEQNWAKDEEDDQLKVATCNSDTVQNGYCTPKTPADSKLAHVARLTTQNKPERKTRATLHIWQPGVWKSSTRNSEHIATLNGEIFLKSMNGYWWHNGKQIVKQKYCNAVQNNNNSSSFCFLRLDLTMEWLELDTGISYVSQSSSSSDLSFYGHHLLVNQSTFSRGTYMLKV